MKNSARVRAAAVGLALMASSFLAASAGPARAAERPEGETPGTYVRYDWPVKQLSNVRWIDTLDTSPGIANVFWSHQFGFTNGFVGYFGMQTNRDGEGLFLVSIWDTTDDRPGSPGTQCEPFEEDGTGRSCRLNLTPVQGHTYQFDATSNTEGWWTFKVTDKTAGESYVLGKILLGKDVAMDATKMVSWTEYYDWNNPIAQCGDAPYSKLTSKAPTTRTADGRISSTFNKPSLRQFCQDKAQITLTGGTAIQENGVGNSTAGFITTHQGGSCLTAAGRVGAKGCVDDTLTQQWVRSSAKELRADWQCLAPSADRKGVTMRACDGSAAQRWVVRLDRTIKNPSTGLCLSAGKTVKLAACDANREEQRWNTPQGMR